MNEPSDARIHPFDDDRPTLRGGFGTSVATSRLSLADVSLLDDVAACEPSPPPGPDPLVGVVVADRYRIVAPIGRGGMGVVYEVEHVRIGKLLAMKLLAGDLARDPVTVSRFKREALAASRLQSPNTVQVLDFGVWAGLSYLVMELVQGESLGRILRRGAAMSLARVCKIAVQVLGSLAEAHDKGVVHRDIKPDNVMLVRTPDGAEIAKLVDFGLAKLRDDVDEITSHGLVVGTPYYMPPEQIRGEPVDARADLYSVGALVYRLLTAEHVFDGAPLAVLSKHLHEAPAAPSARAPARDVPAAVDRVVLKALAKDPAARWTSADELRAALVAAVHGAGSASLRRLLDPERVQSIADRAAQADVATRDDVDAYERRLRRRRLGVGSALVGALAFAAGCAMVIGTQPAAFDGIEHEPNDTPARANPLPLGRAVRGQLGARLGRDAGDRDVYAVDVPGPRDAVVSLHLEALPNLAACVEIAAARGGAPTVGRFCGAPGVDVDVPRLALAPGRHFIAIEQDVSAGAPLQENVSDFYTLTVDRKP